MKNVKIYSATELAAMIVLLGCMIAMPFVRTQWTPIVYIYALGAIALVVSEFFRPLPEDKRKRRLAAISAVGAILVVISAGLLVYGTMSATAYAADWLPFLLSGIIVRLFANRKL